MSDEGDMTRHGGSFVGSGQKEALMRRRAAHSATALREVIDVLGNRIRPM